MMCAVFRKFPGRAFSHAVFLVLISFTLAGCGGEEGLRSEAKYPTGADRGAEGQDIYAEPGSIFGSSGDGITLFGDKKRKGPDGGSGMAINSYLWRASLDTVSFMPLSSADPFGGVIITDWYQPEDTPEERFKANVFILSRELRTDGVTVKLFRQEKQNGQWVDVEPSDKAQTRLEDVILTRARAMYVADKRAKE